MANFNLGEELKKVLLAGIGAAATTYEKGQELVDQLVEKGELTVEQGKVMNEELKRTVKDKVKENVTVVVKDNDATVDNVLSAFDKLTPEEQASVMEKMAKKDQTDVKEENANGEDQQS